MELREKIAREIQGFFADDPYLLSIIDLRALEYADAILALPEIREALLLMATANRRFVEAVRPADPGLAYLQSLQNAHPLANLLKPEDMPSVESSPAPHTK